MTCPRSLLASCCSYCHHSLELTASNSHTASSYVFRQDASTSTSAPPPRSPPRPDLQLTSHRTTSPSSLPSASTSSTPAPTPKEKSPGEIMVDLINNTEDLYKILGIGRRAKSEEVRKAFLGRSRVCHPE